MLEANDITGNEDLLTATRKSFNMTITEEDGDESRYSLLKSPGDISNVSNRDDADDLEDDTV